MSSEELQKKLQSIGFDDVPKNIVDEFQVFLKKEDDELPNNNNHNASRPSKRRRRGSKRRKTQKSEQDEENHQLSLPYDYEGEDDMWLKKIQILQKKANSLDLKLQTWNEVCIANQKYSASPLYYHNYENYKDPYPKIKNYQGGRGYIRPPDYGAFRHRYPIYKKDIYSRPPEFILELRASERRPRPYVPGNEQRNDNMRYRLKERMVKSHPDYYV